MGEVKGTTLHVGLDDYEEVIAVGDSVAGSGDPPVFVGPIGKRHTDIDRLVRRLHSKAGHLAVVYKAGPGGYGAYR